MSLAPGPVFLRDPLIPDLPFHPAVGPVSVSFSPVPSLAEIVERNPRVEAGGRYRPAGCEPRSRTAIIVPHRAREQHLRLLLYHLHPFLQRQQLAYGIYVIHQVPPAPPTFLCVKLKGTPPHSRTDGFPERLRGDQAATVRNPWRRGRPHTSRPLWG